MFNVGCEGKQLGAKRQKIGSFCLDFGVDKNGKHYLIEVNDGHSHGSYGMGAISYAKLLSARWSEMTQTVDYLNF